MKCIIAEKPSVARDIARIVGATHKEEGCFSGNGHVVTWAFGHLVTLAMPEAYGFPTYSREQLPIIPEPFRLVVRQIRKGTTYTDDPSALKQLNIIRKCFDRSDRIIVATDAGREGELIFRLIYAYLDCRKPFDRLWISSLTDKAIREGLSRPADAGSTTAFISRARLAVKPTGLSVSMPAAPSPSLAEALIPWEEYRHRLCR